MIKAPVNIMHTLIETVFRIMRSISRSVLSFLLFVFGSSYIYANGPLQMKGFHRDLPLEEACRIMSSFKSERGSFIFNEEQKKCGFGRNGFISYPCIIGKKNSQKVESIILSPDVVNGLYDAEKMNTKTFARSFAKKYRWIDTFSTKGIYRQKSEKYGWSLTINKRKWIKIDFP